MYFQGYGVEKNFDEVFKLFKLSADQNNPEAQFRLGDLYLKGNEIEKSIQKAFKMWEKSAKNNFQHALDYLLYYSIQEKSISHYYLGKIFSFKKLYDKSINYYISSFLNGNLKPLNKLMELSNKKISRAQYELGNIFEKGINGYYNIEKSIEYYKLSFENGDINARKQYYRLINSNFFSIYEFEELETFILNFNFDIVIPSKILNFIENQYIYFIENIYIYIKIRPFQYMKMINLIENIFPKLKNQHLFKQLILSFGSYYSNFLIYQLFKKKFLSVKEITFFPLNLSKINLKRQKFELYFPQYFNFNNNNILSNYSNIYLSENNYQKLYELIEFGFFKDSIEYFTKYDEINQFIENFSNINPDFQIIITFLEFSISKKNITLIELAASFGSINIFKYLFQKEFNLNIKKTLLYLIKSGCIDLIKLFSIKDYFFFNYKIFKYSLKYKNYDLFNWFKDNYQKEMNFKNFFVKNSIKYYIYYLLEQNENLNNIFFQTETEYFFFENLFFQTNFNKFDDSKINYILFFDQFEIFNILIDKGINFNFYLINYWKNLLIYFKNLPNKLFEKFINLGINVNSKNNEGKTLLFFSFDHLSSEYYEHFINEGAYLNIFDNLFKSPLHYSSINKDLKSCKLFITKGIDINCQDNEKKTALHYSVLNEQYDICELLISNGINLDIEDLNRKKAINYCIEKFNEKILKLFIKNNYNLNYKNKLGRTILYEMTNPSLQCSIFQLLIENGININSIDNFGKNVLHYFAEYNIFSFCEILIKNKIDLNIRDHYGKTPLHYACQINNTNLYKLLIKNGADENIFDNNNKKPQDYKKNNLCKI